MPSFNELGQPIGEPLAGWLPPPTPPRETIEGRHCRLVPLDAALHAECLYDAIARENDAGSWTYLLYGPFDSFGEYRAWLAGSAASADPLFFALEDRQRGKAAGVASYLRITPASGSIEVGHIYFSPTLRRSVAATEAMFLLMRRAFELGYRRCEWKCDSLNGPSRAAAERLGFSLEGIFRQATVYKDRNRDTSWYSVLDCEWPSLGAAIERWLAPENFKSDGGQLQRLSDLTREVRGCR